MGITANVQNIDILNVRAKVEKIMGKNPRKIDQINIEIIFKSPISNKHKIILERAANHCPVAKTLDCNIEDSKEIYIDVDSINIPKVKDDRYSWYEKWRNKNL